MGCCATKEKRENKNEDPNEAPDSDAYFKRRLDEIYRKYDTNHDGSLDRYETKQLLKETFKDQNTKI